MGFSRAKVVETAVLNPRLIRIRLDVPDLADIALPNQPDEVVAIYFPVDGRDSPPDMECRDGVWGYYDVDPVPEGRNYTVRAIEPGTTVMTVDFVVHDHGVATTWAQRTRVGDEVAMAHGRGWYRPGPGTDWQLLVADLAGLPALARIIDELPDGVRATAIVEVVDESDLDYLPARDGVELISLVGSGNGYGDSRLDVAVEEFDHPEGRGYCWFAAEAKASRAVRKHLRRRYGWKADQCDILGYWRFDGEKWARKFEAEGAEALEVYTQALAEGKTPKVAGEEYDDALERVGL
ncbi:siderophore-interacting protein [Nocardia sp. 348MFTsu5.1]|uniref:siderophore-interacting protein n=1 Tax=Nocardia sp. 348MFTsu5.1 TaxID=1172185 RepID=UPI00035EB01A|nr:siderophore-interacting protein [Nocardia sp. 348MFTsu5.1]